MYSMYAGMYVPILGGRCGDRGWEWEWEWERMRESKQVEMVLYYQPRGQCSKPFLFDCSQFPVPSYLN